MQLGNHVSGESNNEESNTSIRGLDSIVQDSQSPLIEECFDSTIKSSQVQNAEAHLGDNQEQEKEKITKANNPVECDSNVIIRASQVHGINLHEDLNPSDVRRNIRSQQFESSLSTEEDDIDGYIMGFQEQEQARCNRQGAVEYYYSKLTLLALSLETLVYRE
ncbi:hypothetical protein RHGRI_007161 [Rhododendron griersonianum]|uniref:Uncharacterized protein n=1 Tax=Rhododendron griersonianum TaxID=479676 RepID=A0AAV6KXH8_9ERIC|nr:hypothetical protein RHGRI_007161 [Rhododendron griersonianum]